ncbi:MAG: hypothetical protein IH946_07740 [Bacteroidetes bacterium]|nr:hypothetical protein [Bacteroidota bacterium]
MCGIFGVISNKGVATGFDQTKSIIDSLFQLSESRGKESAGISVKDVIGNKIWVLKEDIPASDLIKKKYYKNFFKQAVNSSFDAQQCTSPISIMAHSRLVTNGTQENNTNNQPVIKDGVVMIHNGIVTNVNELWDKYQDVLERKYEVDTEVLASLIRYKLKESGNLITAIQSAFSEMEGAASVAITTDDTNTFALATNTGSLYYWISDDKSLLVFASEEYIMRMLLEKEKLSSLFGNADIHWLAPQRGMQITFDDFRITSFELDKKNGFPGIQYTDKGEINDLSETMNGNGSFTEVNFNISENARLEGLLVHPYEKIAQLKRCATTILPETFPFIEFDENGLSNFARNYKRIYEKDRKEEFIRLLEKFRSKNGKPDCIVPFSGGRDSSYGLHLIVKEFGMNPITFTYDWGMVTDLARRNIARMCGKLGVENILVSADIKLKRENIRKNVAAWLRNPELGMIPLFMAGDKFFFSICNDIRKQTGVSLSLWLGNRLENTNFKAGYAGIPPEFDKQRIYSMSWRNKMRLPMYYLRNFLQNPAYLNSSLKDTFNSYRVYYFEPRIDNLLPYDFIKWDEQLFEETLLSEYNWETAPDTRSTWRIGDGTASFYNYIYYTVGGFSENDTFRSNQILEGMISREEALKRCEEENKPRFESIKWYLDTIGLDFENTIKIINETPRRY